MTASEAKENIGKYIYIKAPGLGCGFKQVKILGYKNEKTLWGQGIVTTEQPYGNGRNGKVHYCLTQIHLYDGEIPEPVVKKRKRNGNSTPPKVEMKSRRKRTRKQTEEPQIRKRRRRV